VYSLQIVIPTEQQQQQLVQLQQRQNVSSRRVATPSRSTVHESRKDGRTMNGFVVKCCITRRRTRRRERWTGHLVWMDGEEEGTIAADVRGLREEGYKEACSVSPARSIGELDKCASRVSSPTNFPFRLAQSLFPRISRHQQTTGHRPCTPVQ